MQNRVNHQINLNASLPEPQIGTKLTSLVNRFAQKYKQNQVNHFTNNKSKEKPVQNKNLNSQKIYQQVQHFKKQNYQIKQQLKIVKEDLRLKGQEVKKCNNLICKLQATIKMFNITVNARQKKIQNLMGLAKNLAQLFKTTTQYLPQNIDLRLHSSNIQKQIKQIKEMATKPESEFSQIFNKSQLLQSLNIFERNILELDIFQQIMTGITRGVGDQSQNQSIDKYNSWNIISQLFTQNAIDNDTKSTKIMSKVTLKEVSEPKLFISKQVQESIQPSFSTSKLYHELRLIFDQQIYLFENQGMKFRQFKNKKLIRGQRYECQTCEYYQMIFGDMFMIIKESFRDIKCKLLPNISNYKDIQILI